MPSMSHEMVRDRLEENGWHLHEMPTFLRKNLRRDDVPEDMDESDDMLYALRRHRVNPDAYRLVDEGAVRVLEMAEVVVSNPLTERKLDVLTNLWFAFDWADHYALRVRVFDRFGQQTSLLDDAYFIERFHGRTAA